ncbi:cytidylyltransferase domain-containing protein [Spirochaeta dissipatitropha]
MTGIFIQTRIGSSRLPGKTMLPLGGKPLLQHAMENLRLVPVDHYVLLTDTESEAAFSELAEKCGYKIFAGHPDNVLKRFRDALEVYPLDYIIRATGDNPLVSHEIASKSLQLALETKADYAGLLQPPYGSAVEVISRHALERAAADATTDYQREHVSPYIYQNPELFHIRLDPADAEYRSKARVTVDTAEDYAYINKLFEDLYYGIPISLPEVIQWCKSHPFSELKVS